MEAVELKPSREAMEVALDEMDWGSIGTEDDVFFAVFRAAFRRDKRLPRDFLAPGVRYVSELEPVTPLHTRLSRPSKLV